MDWGEVAPKLIFDSKMVNFGVIMTAPARMTLRVSWKWSKYRKCRYLAQKLVKMGVFVLRHYDIIRQNVWNFKKAFVVSLDIVPGDRW